MKKFNCHGKSALKLNSRTMILKNVFQKHDFRQKKSRFETPHYQVLGEAVQELQELVKQYADNA